MKKMMKTILTMLFAMVVLSNINCGKKEVPTPKECKICKALAAGVDGQTVQQQVCSPEEETAFRNANSGREISCQ
jgi:hypothetical protein